MTAACERSFRLSGRASSGRTSRGNSHGDRHRRNNQHHQEADRRLRQGRHGRGDRHRPVHRRRHRPDLRPGQRRGRRAAGIPQRRVRHGAQPRGGQRRRGAVRRVAPHQGRRPRQPHRPHRRGPGGRRAERPGREPSGRAHRRPRPHRDHGTAPDRVEGAGHRPAPAGDAAPPDRSQGHRLHDPHRARPAGADHRRPPDRQDRGLHRHHHQPEGRRRHLHLRRRRPEALHRGPGRGPAQAVRRHGLHHRGGGHRLGVGAAPVHRALQRLHHGRAHPRQRRPRPGHLRRPLEARGGLPAALAAACAVRRAARPFRATSSTCIPGCWSGRPR